MSVASVSREVAAGEIRTPVYRLLLMLALSPRLRPIAVRLALSLEGGQQTSWTLRQVLQTYFGVEIGAYTYGPWLAPGALPYGVKVGRFVSVAPRVSVYRRDHPLQRTSLHPFFYNPALGVVSEYKVPATPLHVGHDVWIGEGSIIVSGCQRIGNGAVVAAGAVVTRDVPAYAVVAGVPARVIARRFDESTAAAIDASRWWERPISELSPHKELFADRLASVEVAREIAHRIGHGDGDAQAIT